MQGYSHTWPVEEPRASIVLVHGAGEHHGRYAHVAAAFGAQGIEVVTGDLPGWGRSAGRKGHIDSFSQYLDTVQSWVGAAVEKANGAYPVFLLGHSMGGLVSVRFIQRGEGTTGLAGVLLSSPCLELKVPVPPWKARLAGWLDKGWPTLRLASGISPEMVSRDPVVQQAYVSDPLQYPKVSVRWFQELHRAMEAAWAERERLSIPALVLQAGDDALVNADAVERFTAGLPGDVTFRRYPGMRHELLNEPEKDEVLRTMIAWMQQHGL